VPDDVGAHGARWLREIARTARNSAPPEQWPNVCEGMIGKSRFQFRVGGARSVRPGFPDKPPFVLGSVPAGRRRQLRHLVEKISLFASIALTVCAAQAADGYRLVQIDGHDVKWGTPVFGSGATLTYAIVDGQTDFSGTFNCRRIAGIGGVLAGSRLTRRTFDRELSAAFSVWEAAANLHFLAVNQAASADILITAESVPEGVAYADLTLSTSNENSVAVIKKGIVCLNPELRWTTDELGKPEKTSANVDRTVYRLRYTLAHEIGHVLGLNHPGPTGQLMSFEYNANFDVLQTGDITGIVALYGSRIVTPRLASNVKGVSAR
jgi:hypothetical protein